MHPRGVLAVAVNDFSTILTPLLAQGLEKMREKSVLPRIVNHDFDPAPGAKGSTVQIMVMSDISATDIVPGHIAPDTQALVPTVTNLVCDQDRKSTRLNSSHLGISYAVFCLKTKT